MAAGLLVTESGQPLAPNDNSSPGRRPAAASKASAELEEEHYSAYTEWSRNEAISQSNQQREEHRHRTGDQICFHQHLSEFRDCCASGLRVVCFNGVFDSLLVLC